MYDFLKFTESLGLVVDYANPDMRLRRCRTVDHPKRKNGAFWFGGKYGWAMNWATGAAGTWKNGELTRQDRDAFRDRMRAMEADVYRRRKDAVSNAHRMLRDSEIDTHPYLISKALPEEKGFVLDNALLVPMADCLTNETTGLQRISLVDNEWSKKMLPGQRAKGAVYVVGPRIGETILCEGYATGLSIACALRKLNLKVSVTVTFSAMNLVHVANLYGLKRMSIYADNDKSEAGEKAAIMTGLPYVMSDHAGHDANDDHLKLGLTEVCRKVIELRSQ